ncbi:MAG TPA: 2Fe-2S iron-sulfur cluster-binding protein [Candidatus Polarisedimenticolia bacterium]|jgi:NADH-quinone oxidoreductase subunit G
MSDKIKLTIDGRQIEVEKGTTVLQAAGSLGLDVPRYCYHPGLTIAGNCRICLVDIEKMPKLVTSCTAIAADGMVVSTKGPKVEDGRRAVMEFLLANHPLDCPICDQAGECRLQDYSFQHGQGGSRFEEEKVRGLKQEPVGPHVVLDTERCIVCTRCVRFCQEVTGTGELGVFDRGVRSYIGVFPGQQLDNPYSGNTVDICPVGALTLSEFRFKKRVWELRNVPSICGSCARGCNVDLGTADNRIWRITPRENQHVNRWWICDEGRLSYEPLDVRPRLIEAQARRDGKVSPVRWPEALDLLAARLKECRPEAVAAIAPATLTVEDLYMVKRFFSEVLKSERIIVPEKLRGKDDGILIRADKSPNAAGARLLGLEVDAGNHRLAALMEEAHAGRIDAILVMTDGQVPFLDAAGVNSFVCVITPFADGPVATADLALPAPAYGEFEGTWVNFEGRAQRVRRALTPPGVALEGWRVMEELMRRMGTVAPSATAGDLLAEIAAKVPSFAGITVRTIGALGVQVPS